MDVDASRVEEKFVYEVYDNIAEHFDHTRHSQWKGVQRFLNSLAPFSLVLDVGCGNGKYLAKDHLFKIGCDRSGQLCKICDDKGFPVFTADCLALPIVEDRFDAVLSIAVIHHLATEERRTHALEEMLRSLKSGGRGLIYVWAFEQQRKGEASVYLKKQQPSGVVENEDQLPVNEGTTLPVHHNGTQFLSQDLLVPWTRQSQKKVKSHDGEGDKEVFLRFYHVFREGELEDLCGSLDRCVVSRSFYEQGNWCIEFEKR